MSSGDTEGGRCGGCITRTPHASLLALIMCWVGAGIFCGSMHRGITLTLSLLQEVFKVSDGLAWFEPVQLAFTITGAVMGAVSVMILVTSILATGDTRLEVYTSRRGRAGGRLATGVFIILSYVLLLAWLLIFIVNIVVTTLYTLSWGVCSDTDLRGPDGALDFYYFNFLFPPGSQRVNMLLEGPLEINLFCREFVERAEIMFILSTISSFIVIMSLVHFLMALSANYAHIRGYDKFTDLKDLYTMDFSNTIAANSPRHNNYRED